MWDDTLPTWCVKDVGIVTWHWKGWFEHKHYDITTADMMTKMATKWLSVYRRGHWTKRWFMSLAGQMGLRRFYHTTQNGVLFTTYKLFISKSFHLILSDQIWLQVTETHKRESLYYPICLPQHMLCEVREHLSSLLRILLCLLWCLLYKKWLLNEYK